MLHHEHFELSRLEVIAARLPDLPCRLAARVRPRARARAGRRRPPARRPRWKEMTVHVLRRSRLQARHLVVAIPLTTTKDLEPQRLANTFT